MTRLRLDVEIWGCFVYQGRGRPRRSRRVLVEEHHASRRSAPRLTPLSRSRVRSTVAPSVLPGRVAILARSEECLEVSPAGHNPVHSRDGSSCASGKRSGAPFKFRRVAQVRGRWPGRRGALQFFQRLHRARLSEGAQVLGWLYESSNKCSLSPSVRVIVPVLQRLTSMHRTHHESKPPPVRHFTVGDRSFCGSPSKSRSAD